MSCYVATLPLLPAAPAVVSSGWLLCWSRVVYSGVEDIFLAKPAWRAFFDAYWETAIGTVPQYWQAAAQAGLVPGPGPGRHRGH